MVALLTTGCVFSIPAPENLDEILAADLPANDGAPPDMTGDDLATTGDLSEHDLALAPSDLARRDMAVVPPTCGDNMKNGAETDVDCGGALCPRCPAAKTCTTPADCLSGVCNGTCGGGLVAWWRFDEGSGNTVADSSGNGHNGSIVGASWTNNGRVGGALDFDGQGDYVTVPDDGQLDLTDAMTVSAWVTADTFPTWATILIKTSGGSWTSGYGIYFSDSNGPLCTFVVQWDQTPSCGAFAQTSNFRHVAATYDKTMLRLYLDGAQVAAVARTPAITTNNSALLIGVGNGGYYWNGKIDEVRIFDRALAAGEIAGLYNTP